MNRRFIDSIVKRKCNVFIFLSALACMHFLFLSFSFPQENEPVPSATAPKTLTLDQATMCEEIVDHGLKNPAIVFSIKKQQIYCFSTFDSVPEKSFVYHNWYREEKLSTKIKLLLQPPAWATFSRIQLREADRGPWRVEITDQDGNVLKILRFSVTN
jgi:hypothetical protein